MPKAKIFLSYGRRDSEEIAQRLKHDLEKLDYEIWIDRSEIKVGTAWMNQIANGLNSSQAVVALLSPHSVRVSGVDGADSDSICLDELAYARDCPGRILPVMVAECQVPLILYRLHYIDLRSWSLGSESYQSGLRSIVDGIEAALRNETHFRHSTSHLQPWDFTPFLEERRRGFVGRHWLFSETQSWLEAFYAEPCLLITADPGVGKSAFVAQWVHLNPGGRLLAYHCCQLDSPTTLQPFCFIRSLAAMLASQLPEYEARLQDPSVEEALREDACRDDPARGFDAGILSPLLRISPPEGGSRCILIDALDEAILLKQGPTIVDILVDRLSRLPKWLRIVATTRKEPAVLRQLARLRASQLDAQDPRNIADAMAFLDARLKEPALERLANEACLTLPAVIEMLLERSKGNFLYLHYALEGLAVGNYHLDRPEDFPPGLPGFYEKAFRHRFISEQEYLPAADILAVVLAAHEPLEQDLLFSASRIESRRDFLRVLKKLAVYLPERDGRYSLFHRSLGEWLRDSRNNEDYCIEPIVGERRLADVGWEAFTEQSSELQPYMLRYLPHHLAAASRWKQLAKLLSDFDVLSAAWRAGREHEWMRFWRMLSDHVDLVASYRDSIDRLLAKGANQIEIASMSTKVGVLLRDLGEADQALPFIENAIQILRSGPVPPQDSALASALLDLAETYFKLGNDDRAQALYDEALERSEKAHGGDSAEVGNVVHAMCVFYNTSSKHDLERAIALNERAIWIREKLSPSNPSALADALNDKAVLLWELREFEAAHKAYLRSRELFEQSFPEGHPELGVVLSNLGNCHRQKKEFEIAIECYLKGLIMRELYVVPYDSKCQSIRRGLLHLFLDTGQQNEALKWALEVVNQGRSDPRYDSNTKCEDLFNFVAVAALANRTDMRDQGIAEFRNELKEPSEVQFEPLWERFGDIYLLIVTCELNERRFDNAMSLFLRGLTEFENQEPSPQRALSIYCKKMSELIAKVGIPSLIQQFINATQKIKFDVEWRIPELGKLNQIKGLIDSKNSDPIQLIFADILDAAFTTDPPDRDRLKNLSKRANEFAIRVKNELNTFDLAEWFYLKGLELDPENSCLMGNFAFFLTSVRHQHEKAETLYERALELAPDDANCLSNFAVFQSHIRRNFDRSEELFQRARNQPNGEIASIIANHSILQIISGDLELAFSNATRSYELGSKRPDRILARPLFSALCIYALGKHDFTPFVAQLKSLFMTDLHRAPWQIDALFDFLRPLLVPASFEFLIAVFNAICCHSCEQALEQYAFWTNPRPTPMDKPWPKFPKEEM